MTLSDVSISNLLLSADSKAYVGTMLDAGFEWGVGRSGVYDSHSHQSLCDVLYAPSGMRIGIPDAGILKCRFFLACPGVFFDPLEISNFWFMKFLGRPRDIRDSVPDKSLDYLHDDGPGVRWLAADHGSWGCAFYDWRSNNRSDVRFSILDESSELLVTLRGISFRVRR